MTLVAWAVRDRLLFQPPAPSYSAGAAWLVTLVGEPNLACRYQPGLAGAPLVIISHGNAEDLGGIGWWVRGLQAEGFSVLAYDYPGYGQSSGSATVATSTAAAVRVYDYAVGELGYPAERIVVYGRSLGGALAAYQAQQRPVAGLILESAFTSAYRVMTRIAIVPGDVFNNLDVVASNPAPVLVVHGRRDRVIPVWHGQALAAAASGSELYLDDAGHNDPSDPARRATVSAFIRRCMAPQPSVEGGAGPSGVAP
ncbi:MAG: alpha/beta hydrolase [Planctomycetota bacterium]|nr:alpha/beta hydrolase [Planctomycetota bacterium]